MLYKMGVLTVIWFFKALGNVGHDKKQGDVERGVQNRGDCNSQAAAECDIIGE